MSELVQIDTRNTNWRQGDFLTSGCSVEFGFKPELAHIVITHDCDIAADMQNEPYVEIISGKILSAEELNQQLTTGRSPRELHIPCSQGDGTIVHVQLFPLEKRLIPKNELLRFDPSSDLITSKKSKTLLRTWLACRYRRHALPNELVERLRKVLDKLEAVGKKKNEGVIATFLAYDPDGEIEDPEEPYEIKFRIVYEHLSPIGKTNADAMAAKLKQALENAEGIESNDVKVFADTEFTLFDMTQMVEWRFEHLSFRGEIIGTMIEP